MNRQQKERERERKRLQRRDGKGSNQAPFSKVVCCRYVQTHHYEETVSRNQHAIPIGPSATTGYQQAVLTGTLHTDFDQQQVSDCQERERKWLQPCDKKGSNQAPETVSRNQQAILIGPSATISYQQAVLTGTLHTDFDQQQVSDCQERERKWLQPCDKNGSNQAPEIVSHNQQAIPIGPSATTGYQQAVLTGTLHTDFDQQQVSDCQERERKWLQPCDKKGSNQAPETVSSNQQSVLDDPSASSLHQQPVPHDTLATNLDQQPVPDGSSATNFDHESFFQAATLPAGYKIPKLSGTSFKDTTQSIKSDDKLNSRRNYMQKLMSKKRLDNSYKAIEKSRERITRKARREDTRNRETERKNETSSKKKKRADSVYRDMERTNDTSKRKKKRADSVYRDAERTNETSIRKKRRADSVYREMERTNDTCKRKKKRADSVYRDAERTNETSIRKKRRADSVYREMERTNDTCKRKKKRADSVYRDAERTNETSIRKKRRADSVYREMERTNDTCKRKKKRADSVYRDAERTNETSIRKKRRADSVYREMERTNDTCKRKKKRADSVYRDAERTNETSIRKKKRADSVYREMERTNDTCKRKKKRADSVYRDAERTNETSIRKKKRADNVYRVAERTNDTSKRKKKREDYDYRKAEKHIDCVNKQIKRTDKQYKAKEAQHANVYRQKKKDMNIQERIDYFHTLVKKGPVYICTSCQQLLYRHSVSVYKVDRSLSFIIPKVTSIDGKLWICSTCKSYVSKNKIPPMSSMNKIGFPVQGILSDLNPLEQNLLAVRLPFMKIHEAPRGRQKFIRGNMVLVPADVQNTVSQLPRLTSNTATIRAKLKRKLQYKHHVYSVNIRPEVVRNCAQYLSTRSLYKEHVTFNTNWDIDQQTTLTSTDGHSTDIIEPSTSGTHSDVSIPSDKLAESEIVNNSSVNEDDMWSEIDENEITSGMCDTMLSAQDFLEPDERDFVFNFAPGEGGAPISVFLEKEAEELAFPGIFCGESRPNNNERPVNVTYGEIVKSELRNKDRRAACSIENIFFKAKKIQMKILIDQTNILIRKVKTGNEALTVKDIRGEAVNNPIYQDKAYKSLASIRGSPPYFEKTSKDLFAMIRQLGTATFFITLSAAETRWPHLLSILGQIVDKTEYTEDEIASLTWEDKCRLIQSDPVTCARHFDFQVNKFLHEFLLTSATPVGQIEDYFYRVEYQNRGSPHIHMVVWCSNAPQYGTDSDIDICQYVDQYITCFLPDEESSMKGLVELQRHRHSHTCQMKKKKRCRFGYPKPILDKTVILQPLSTEEFSKKETATHKANWEKIYEALNNINESDPFTHKEFLTQLQLNEADYINAIRSSIKRATVFLKRSSSETRVNNYNKSVLSAWKANTDIQFVLDVYACATYVASYLTKSQRGMSELLRKATQEANQGNNDIRQQVKVVGNKFLNSVEISAQEAVYLCLQLPMKKASRHVIFINTSPPEERVTLLKPKHILDGMDDEDEDIECNSLLSRYAERPKDMEECTLAEFSSLYEKMKAECTSRSEKQTSQSVDTFLPEPQNIENEDDIRQDKPSKTPKQTTKYRKRTRGHIIRPVHFNPDVDTEKFYRELVVLYYPWRDEKCLRGDCETYSDRFKQIQEDIENCRKKFEPYSDAVNEAQNLLNSEPDLEDVWNELAAGTEYENTCDKDNQETILDTGIEDYNIGSDLGVPITTSDEDLHEFHEMLDEPYRVLMQSLNKEQTEFVSDTMHSLKHSGEQLFRFLSGGAGVGKSFVVKALYQSALKYFNKQAGENFTAHNILLLAPTGKAAYHINGSTIHSALKIPANNKLEHRPLRSGQLNTLRNKIGKLKLIFIDEISMVGFRMLNFIHQRMMEIMQSPKPFGGVSIIVVGDLFQLEPVFDTYAFVQPSSGFMPLATNLWKDLFQMFELKQIMRQADSKQFAELLNRLREGNQTSQDLNILRSRHLSKDSSDYPHHLTHLMHTNEKVNAYNNQVIQRSQNQVYTIKAKDRVIGSTPHGMRKKILDNFVKNHEKNCQLPNEVLACKDIFYDLTVNLNTSDGLTNGASCKIVKIDIETQESCATGIIWVTFLDNSCGRILRKELRKLYKPGYNKLWTPIQPVVKEFNAGKDGQAQIQRYQFPLRPAHAKSIHRSQGDTLDSAVIDLTLTRQVKHIHYVALSRLQTLEGLHILNLQDDKISVDKRVQKEMERLRGSPLPIQHHLLDHYPHRFKLAFVNARSLNRHLEDVRADRNAMAADIVCFCETRFHDKDSTNDTSIKDFVQYRQDYQQSASRSRPPYGLAVYSKTNFSKGPWNESAQAEITVFSVDGQKDVMFVFIYKPPKTSCRVLIDRLDTIHNKYLRGSKTVIFGDFNIDWCEESQDKYTLQTFMSKYSYSQILRGPSNDFNSTIDLIFTNMDGYSSGVLETYYTDHRMCWAGW